MTKRRRKVSQPIQSTQSMQVQSPPIQPPSIQPVASQLQSNLVQPVAPVQSMTGREITSRPEPDFIVRTGDKLTVMYNGVKLGIAPFSTVELDGSIYSRMLEEGDDPVEQWDKIYNYLKGQCLKVAREKLRIFSDELRAAKQRVNPENQKGQG